MEMVEVKTAELEGTALDYAVTFSTLDPFPEGELDWHIACTLEICKCGVKPSTEWASLGPLLESFDIQLSSTDDEPGYERRWNAHLSGSHSGPTPLIAACRAIVALRLGDVVSVPADLFDPRVAREEMRKKFEAAYMAFHSADPSESWSGTEYTRSHPAGAWWAWQTLKHGG